MAPSSQSGADSAASGRRRLHERRLAGTAVLVFAATLAGELLVYPGTNVGLFWPAAGISVGLLALWGNGMWAGVAIGAAAGLLPGLWSNHQPGSALFLCLVEVIAHVVPPLVGAALARRALRGAHPLDRTRDLLAFLTITGPVAQLLGASLGVAALLTARELPPSAAPAVWLQWWTANIASVIVFAPLCLAWLRPGFVARPLLHLGGAAATLAACAVVFHGVAQAARTYLEYLTVLLVAWSAFLLGPAGASAASATIAVFAVWGTALGRGPIPAVPLAGPLEERLLLLSFLLSTISLTGLILSTVLGQRERAMQRLAESEALLRRILESSPLPIGWSDAQGRIEFWNLRAEELFGWKREQLPDLATLFRLAWPDEAQRQLAIEQWRRATDGAGDKAGAFDAGELEVTCRDGGRRIVHFFGNEAGDRSLAIFQDVTALRQAENARAELRDRLEESRRLESLGRLAGFVAHDLNNLLLPILGFAELQLQKTPPGTELASDLQQIHHAGERARDLTKQLLAFGRKQILEVQPVDLHAALLALEKLLRRLLRDDIELELRASGPRLIVLADPGQLDQVVINLALNAQHAMPHGGRLSLSLSEVVGPRDLPGEGSQAEEKAGRWVQLEVTDTGTGIEPQLLTRIFEPFFTTRPKGEGTGLGLAIVHGVVSQHGGRIEVESVLGRGATFRILLPEAPDGVEPAARVVTGEVVEVKAPPPQPLPRARPRTVLLCEDEDAVRNVVSLQLERLGYHVLPAWDAVSCLALAESTDEPIDLLLSDVRMPGLSGPQLYERLRERLPTLRVLFMSGYTGDVAEQLSSLKAAFLAKPFNAQALAAAVQDALGT